MNAPSDANAAADAALEFATVLDGIATLARGPVAADRIHALTPSTDLDWIGTQLALVAELLDLRRRAESLEITPVPDLRGTLGRLKVPGSVLELSQVVDVRRVLAAGRLMLAELDRIGERAPLVARLAVSPVDRALEKRLERSVDDDGELLDSASPALAAARRAVHTARERLVKRLEALLREIDGSGSVTMREGRYVIPIRRDARHRPDGIVHDESASAGTLFVEPTAAIALGNALRAAVAAEEREVLAVLRELTDFIRPERASIAALFEMAVTLDALAARADWAFDTHGHRPMMVESGGTLQVVRGRHPLLLMRGIDVVPFDLTLDPGQRTLLITGPNTGGKTVLLKAVGLIIRLAQSGVIPPVDPESILPTVDRVFVDIGDHQSLAADLSTFSAHVAELRRILDDATADSLVILDEVGSGTDPAEGGALAMAVLEELTRRGTLVLATTHLGALKELATRVPGVVNGSLTFDAATLSPTYRFTKGVPGRSYGLAIARRLGLDAAVLEAAEAMVPDADRTLDRLLASIESRTEELETREGAVAERLIEAERREAVAAVTDRDQAERESLLREQERNAERDRARQAKAYLLEARKRVEDALALAKGAADEASAREARRLVEEGVREQADRLEEVAEPALPGSGRLAVGARVRLGTGATGEIAELRTDGRAVVLVGSMRLVVKATTLTRLPDASTPVRASAIPRIDDADRAVIGEVDLRGLRVDEAETEVLAALDGAVMSAQPHLAIIHGMGTGVLRDTVRQLLAADTRVASYDFAPRTQGGTGVTIAVLR
ncbi:MAG TPA: Smr/MutS family protein [Gemmatimonadales bacterium]|nr:Smr/MutS family protein [Gemmatimonadales bacterium]